MPGDVIQWFPGHMAKTRRLIKENLPLVDIVIEVLDSRIPYSSENPEIDGLLGDKPKIVVLSKASLADPSVSTEWEKYYKNTGRVAIFCDFITGSGVGAIVPAVKKIMADRIESYDKKGMSGRAITAMAVGIPNVGKSTLINTLCKGKKAKAENRPGVTTTKQWLKTDAGLDLLDMPGVLWPKFEDRTVGENLAVTGAIKDEILNIDELATVLCDRLFKLYPKQFCERYRLSESDVENAANGYEILCAVGKKRGCLVKGGQIDINRISNILMDEFRSGKIGRISLERPEV